MKDVPLLDELRAARQRLADNAGLDPEQYAIMLRRDTMDSSIEYVSEQLLPVTELSSPKLKEAS